MRDQRPSRTGPGVLQTVVKAFGDPADFVARGSMEGVSLGLVWTSGYGRGTQQHVLEVPTATLQGWKGLCPCKSDGMTFALGTASDSTSYPRREGTILSFSTTVISPPNEHRLGATERLVILAVSSHPP